MVLGKLKDELEILKFIVPIIVVLIFAIVILHKYRNLKEHKAEAQLQHIHESASLDRKK